MSAGAGRFPVGVAGPAGCFALHRLRAFCPLSFDALTCTVTILPPAHIICSQLHSGDSGLGLIISRSLHSRDLIL